MESGKGGEQSQKAQGQFRPCCYCVSGSFHAVGHRQGSWFEERWITMGYDQDGRLLVVSHTYSERDSENNFVRIISARRATRKERHQYETVK